MAKNKRSKKAAAKKPTDAELAILGVIWDLGSATVREVHGVLSAESETGQTTVLKHMQIMVEKGLLTTRACGRRFIQQRSRVRRRRSRCWVM